MFTEGDTFIIASWGRKRKEPDMKTLNLYATPREIEDSLPGEISLSLKRLREIKRDAFNQGVEACRAEREHEMCLAAQGDNAGHELHLEE